MFYSQTSTSVWNKLPISINDTYGDPYFAPQVDNTVSKLEQLRFHQAPIATFTKSPYDKDVIAKLKALRDIKPLVLYYSLTGTQQLLSRPGASCLKKKKREISILIGRLY